MPKLDVDGVGLAYDDVGRRDGVPLVFIHGWTANRHRWDDQLGHFAGRYRVISLDLRGHGDSDLTPHPYTIGGLAREVLALLDGLGVDRFVPVGHSMGGMIALTLALEHPETRGTLGGRRLRKPHDVQPRPTVPDSPVATTAVQDVRCGEYSTSIQTGVSTV